VELQPLAAQAARVALALDRLGEPLSETDRKAIAAARTAKNKNEAVATIQGILDRRCLAMVRLEACKGKTNVIATRGPAVPELQEQGWRVFLVKVANSAGISNQRLQVTSPNAAPLTRRSTSSSATPCCTSPPTTRTSRRWCARCAGC
jgi:hypothetical protein